MRFTVHRLLCCLALAGVILSACDERSTKHSDEPKFSAVSFSDLPGWGTDTLFAALPALRRSCKHILARPPQSRLGSTRIGGRVTDWQSACRGILDLGADESRIRSFIEVHFQPFLVAAGPDEFGLFTGYYEPEISGTRQPGTVPLYQRPDDLVQVNLSDWRMDLRGKRIAGRVIKGRLKPYHTRADIEMGALEGKASPLAWIDDPVDAFFLHIQGSGRILLEDGSALRVGYDGQNGHIYYPIGRYLIETGEIERGAVSLQTIRAWLAANPDRMHEVMNRNPSYVFFREIEGDGPIGSQGTVLTPGRSLAVDGTVIPMGAPVWVSVDYQDANGRPVERLMVSQDTGGAIKGAVRGDIFWGSGVQAEALAGPMKARGRYYVLLPKTLTDDLMG